MRGYILLDEIPMNCTECSIKNECGECLVQEKFSYGEQKKNCPIKTIPSRKKSSYKKGYKTGYSDGWNDCLDEIVENDRYDEQYDEW